MLMLLLKLLASGAIFGGRYQFRTILASCCDRVEVEVAVVYSRASDLQKVVCGKPVVRFLEAR
jgi:hypothetical protein